MVQDHLPLKLSITKNQFVRENIYSKEIDLRYFDTNDNVEDMFTKPLENTQLEICKDKLGIVDNSFLSKNKLLKSFLVNMLNYLEVH